MKVCIYAMSVGFSGSRTARILPQNSNPGGDGIVVFLDIAMHPSMK